MFRAALAAATAGSSAGGAAAAAGGSGGAAAPLDASALAAAFMQAAAAAGLRVPAARPQLVPIPYILEADAVMAALRAHPESVAALLPLLPPGQQTEADLWDILRSPQLRQAGMTLTGALDGGAGNMNAVFANFGLRPQDGDAALVAGDPVGAMMAAIQARAERERAPAAAAGGAGSAAAAGAAAAAPATAAAGDAAAVAAALDAAGASASGSSSAEGAGSAGSDASESK